MIRYTWWGPSQGPPVVIPISHRIQAPITACSLMSLKRQTEYFSAHFLLTKLDYTGMSGHPDHGLSRPNWTSYNVRDISPLHYNSQLDLELKGLFMGKDTSEKISLSYIVSSVSSLNFIYSNCLNLKSFLNETGLASSKMLLLSLEERKEKVLQKCILEKSRAWVFSFGM